MPVEYPVTHSENTSQHPTAHYYGDIVRRYFVAAGTTMLVAFQFVRTLIPTVSVYVSIFGALTFVFVAGLQSPRQRWSSMLDVLVAGVGVVAFGVHGIQAYAQVDLDARHLLFFVVNQLLALLFLVAFYYSTKTLRAMYGSAPLPPT